MSQLLKCMEIHDTQLIQLHILKWHADNKALRWQENIWANKDPLQDVSHVCSAIMTDWIYCLAQAMNQEARNLDNWPTLYFTIGVRKTSNLRIHAFESHPQIKSLWARQYGIISFVVLTPGVLFLFRGGSSTSSSSNSVLPYNLKILHTSTKLLAMSSQGTWSRILSQTS